MKHVLLSLVLFLVACTGCSGVSIHPAGAQQFIDGLSDETAQILRRREDGTYRGLCSAVWVSETDMLTAGHCVEPEEQTILDCLDIHDDELFSRCVDGALGGSASIVGSPLPYRSWSDALLSGEAPVLSPRTAHVLRYDHAHDLALLRVSNPPSHRIAVIATEDPLQGDMVHIVGHTHGNPWSYTPGMVGAVRSTANQNGDMVHVVQIVSAASGGNSGGGAFNTRGELIGICVFGSSDAFGFFVHRETVVTFLRG